MTHQEIMTMAVVASTLIALVSMVWTIVWSVKIKRLATNEALNKEIQRLISTQQRVSHTLDDHERRIDQLPTAAAIERINGDIKTVSAQMEGINKGLNGLEKWMARMDEYMHKKDTTS